MTAGEKEKIAGNPLKVDSELKSLLDKLEFVKTYKSFKRWRTSFLDRLEAFFEQENIDTAQAAYTAFSNSMESFVKIVSKVEGFVEKGELTEDHCTVKARNCLAEMTKTMTLVIAEEDALIPQTGPLEKKRGYNKFHMGAVLVRDGFEEYGRLEQCGDVLKHMRQVSLGQVADKQILEEMDHYGVTLQKFCDVMADLGLYEVMRKCREFAEPEEVLLDDILFLDIKTGGIGELSREDCLHKHVLTLNGQDEAGNDLFNEAETDEDKQSKILKMITDTPKLGIGFGNSKNTYNDEQVEIGDMEKIKNMWGVKLRKTPKNAKGEELIFVEQKTGAFGELPRRSLIEKELITEIKDENGKYILGEAEVEFEERSTLVETVRSLLKVGLTEE